VSTHEAVGNTKVLLLSGLQLYPTMSGGTLRSFALANALRHQGFDVSVHSLTGRKSDYKARHPSSTETWPGGVEEYVDRSIPSAVAWFASYVLGLPPLWITAHLAAAAASPREFLLPPLLRQKLAWCDAIVADFPFLHPVFSAPSAQGKVRIVNTHNIEHRLYDDQKRWINRWMRAVVRDIELKAAEACDILVTCCAGDAEFFAANTRLHQSVMVPNGVDVRRFQGIHVHRSRTRQEMGIADDVRLFLFTASKWGPNREAFEYLVDFARKHPRLLADERIHIMVVGNVTAEPLRLPGFTATGKVPVVEPYFAAADVALNPISSGAGTNLKMCEFIALRLPIVSTPFGARGFSIQDGKTGFLFEKDRLAAVLSAVRRLFDENPARLRQIAEDAYTQNESVIDMDACVPGLAQALREAQERRGKPGRATLLAASLPSE
jgi:glycosyltransferase involved in cell wall biosynthesis